MPFTIPLARVFLDAFAGSRRSAPQQVSSKLKTKLAVLNPMSFGCEPFPWIDRGQGSDHSHRLMVAARFHFNHGKSVFLIEESDSFDQAGRGFRVGPEVGFGLQSIFAIGWRADHGTTWVLHSRLFGASHLPGRLLFLQRNDVRQTCFEFRLGANYRLEVTSLLFANKRW